MAQHIYSLNGLTMAIGILAIKLTAKQGKANETSFNYRNIIRI